MLRTFNIFEFSQCNQPQLRGQLIIWFAYLPHAISLTPPLHVGGSCLWTTVMWTKKLWTGESPTTTTNSTNSTRRLSNSNRICSARCTQLVEVFRSVKLSKRQKLFASFDSILLLWTFLRPLTEQFRFCVNLCNSSEDWGRAPHCPGTDAQSQSHRNFKIRW